MRLKIEFSYNGKDYFGYQKQKNKKTIQGELEDVLSQFFGCPIVIVASGRTDAGVSALKQVAHFDLDNEILLRVVSEVNEKNLQGLAIRLNFLLSNDIRILTLSRVQDEFHARYSTKLKTYYYNFYISSTEIPYLSQFCLWLKESKLDLLKIKDAIKYFVGEHDFTSFCATNTEVENKVRTITDMELITNPMGYYTVSITGNGFLYNMVRIIVGTLLDVARGKIKVEDIPNIIKSKDRSRSGKTVSSIGLVLKEVRY